jgi:proteic killer suppression protein
MNLATPAAQRRSAGASARSPAVGPIHFRVVGVYKQIVYTAHVIESFANTETERLFATGKSRRLPPDILRRAVMRLTQLDAASVVEDMRQPPSNRLEVLSGDRAGQWSIRINDQWRVCFRFERGNAFDVEIVDYH